MKLARHAIHVTNATVRAESRASAAAVRRHERRGFTILEVLLAMAILLFGMSAILGLLTFGSVLSRTAQLRTNAAMAVESVTADLEETFFPIVNGEAGEPRAIERRELPGAGTIVYSAVPHQNPDRPLEYRVDVDMVWKSGGVQREKRFTTLLLREIPFGERLRRRYVEGETMSTPPPVPNASPSGTPARAAGSSPSEPAAGTAPRKQP